MEVPCSSIRAVGRASRRDAQDILCRDAVESNEGLREATSTVEGTVATSTFESKVFLATKET